MTMYTIKASDSGKRKMCTESCPSEHFKRYKYCCETCPGVEKGYCEPGQRCNDTFETCSNQRVVRSDRSKRSSFRLDDAFKNF